MTEDYQTKLSEYRRMEKDLRETKQMMTFNYNQMTSQEHFLEALKAERDQLKKWNEELRRSLEEQVKNNLKEIIERKSMKGSVKSRSEQDSSFQVLGQGRSPAKKSPPPVIKEEPPKKSVQTPPRSTEDDV